MNPKVTIITTVLNEAKNLEETIHTVLMQDYSNKEYIIIDGGSTDGSIEIVNKYKKEIAFFESKKDSGISEAFNKGILNSTGDYIIFQGSGDGFLNKNSLSKLMENVNPEIDMIISGRIARVSRTGKILYFSPNINKLNKISLIFKMPLPHQGMCMHKFLFEKYGYFDQNLKYSMDYDFLLRIYQYNLNIKFCNEVISKWVEGGIGFLQIKKVHDEYDFIKKKNKIAHPLILFLVRKIISFKYNFRILMS
jgi:glycosyltransferase involved in cell wall biosynthesis